LTISHGFSLPVSKWPSNHALLQGMAYAKDPRNGREYLFVGKAESAKRGDVEDSYFHRHVFQSGKWVYLDTMVGRAFGHPQNFHVRISAAGNTWLWASVEKYEKDKKIGVQPGRVEWRKGDVTTKDRTFEWIDVPDGSWLVIGTATPAGSPARITLRRGQTDTETYSEHDESVLRSGAWRPLREFKRKKESGGTYQTAAANDKSVFVFQGSTDSKHVLYRHDWNAKVAERLDVTAIKAPTGPNTSSEPEGVAFLRGAWYFAKRYNSTERRQYEAFKITNP